MAYSTYLNMGISYDDEKNYYNALIAYETAITKEYSLTGGLNNIGATFVSVGLQKQALNKYHRAIGYYENGKCKKDSQPWKYFSNRAYLSALLNKSYEHNVDIKRAIGLKENYQNTWMIKGKFEISNNRIQNGIDSFNKAIEVDSNKAYGYRNRAKMYEVLGNYDNAKDDYKKAVESSKKTQWSLYELGKVQFLLKEFKDAERNYNLFLNKGLWSYPYDVPSNIGIVQFIDRQKGFGFIFGATWFNRFDSIFFKLSDCRKIPNQGDRVRFSLIYSNHKGKYEGYANNIETYSCFDILRYKTATTFHCIIHNKANAFKAYADLKYVHVFYPYETILPFSSVTHILNDEIKEALFEDGYAFAEATINLNDDYSPEVLALKPIETNNKFANKIVFASEFRNRRSFQNHMPYSSWTCSVCDGDAATGCQMSDPQYCPMGRGI